MGKRGPQPGTTYRRRILVPERLRIDTDRQLVAAQHFNDRLERLITEIDGGIFPAANIDPRIVTRLMQDLDMVQGAVIAGIESYLVRDAAPTGRRSVAPLNAGGEHDVRCM